MFCITTASTLLNNYNKQLSTKDIQARTKSIEESLCQFRWNFTIWKLSNWKKVNKILIYHHWNWRITNTLIYRRSTNIDDYFDDDEEEEQNNLQYQPAPGSPSNVFYNQICFINVQSFNWNHFRSTNRIQMKKIL